jgi:hypothetical protein
MERADSAQPLALDADRLLTTVECAEVLRLSPRTLERLRVRGVGPRYVKAGPGIRSRVLYRLADIRAWTAAHSYTSTSDYADR